MGDDGSPTRRELPSRHFVGTSTPHLVTTACEPSILQLPACNAADLVLSSVHVKRDATGVVKRREKRSSGGVGQTRKRAQPAILDDDRGLVPDSGEETDIGDHFGLVEASASVADRINSVEAGNMALGAQGDALLAAINASLGSKIDGVSQQVAAVAGRVEVVEKQLVATNRSVEHQGAQLSQLDLRITTLERGKTTPGGADGFCGGADPWQRFDRSRLNAAPTYNMQGGGGAASSGGRPESVASGSAVSGAFSATGGDENDLGRVLDEQFRLPIKRRRLVVLGGFPRNTERALILAKLNEYTADVQLAICPGDYNSKGKWLFASNAAAWKLLKSMKGRKFTITIGGENFTLWHGFDKSIKEQTLARRTMLVHKGIREHFVQKGLGEAAADWRWWKDNLLDADSEIGTVFVKTRATPEAALTVHDVTKKTADGKIAIRTYATERLRNLLTVNRTAAYATEFDKLLGDLVTEANDIKDYDGEHVAE